MYMRDALHWLPYLIALLIEFLLWSSAALRV